jgi:integrase
MVSHASVWSVWDAFCDHHHLDPENPRDEDVVAFIHARAMAGVSYATLAASLGSIRLGIEGTPSLKEAGTLTVAAQRHLSDLHYRGWFAPLAQAPVLTVGQIRSMVERTDDPLDRFLVAVTYLAGLRVSEWTAVEREHVQVDANGLVMWLPVTKTEPWQKVRIQPLAGTPFDITALATAWLDGRGNDPGPLVRNSRGGALTYDQVARRLRRCAAAAGIEEFSTYSLRRSLAVHMDLLGIRGSTIRRRLRHVETVGKRGRKPGQTYRRYLEPLLALMDREGAAGHYLDATAVAVDAVPVRAVGGHTRTVKYAFVADSLQELLDDVDLPKLRVPRGLVDVADSTLATGGRQFRTWARWCRDANLDPSDPPEGALTRWAVTRVRVVDPVTVASDLTSLRIGFLDATGRETMPGWDQAQTVAQAASRKSRAARAPRYKSRPATPEDRVLVCDAVMNGEPPVEWSVACVAWASGARESFTVIAVTNTTTVVSVDGVEKVIPAGQYGLLDPVLAALTLGEGTTVAVRGPVSEADVRAAGRGHSLALRNRLAAVLVAGSGTRPSDIARARVEGVQQAPGGLAVMLRVAKGRRPSRVGRDRLIWAPNRSGSMDPIDAWNAWASWHPASAQGPLLPADVSVDDSAPITAGAVSRVLSTAVRTAGITDLTAYGFRYGRAQEMHDEGLSDETIAEALGHDDLETTRGYIQKFDPFTLLEEADGR